MRCEAHFYHKILNDWIGYAFPKTWVICICLGAHPEDGESAEAFKEAQQIFFKDLPEVLHHVQTLPVTEDYLFLVLDTEEEAQEVWKKIPDKGYYYATLHYGWELRSENC